jgi:hypothetical protein
MPAVVGAVDFVVGWVASGLYMLGRVFIQHFEPDIIAQLKAITLFDNQWRTALFLELRWAESNVQYDIATSWQNLELGQSLLRFRCHVLPF